MEISTCGCYMGCNNGYDEEMKYCNCTQWHENMPFFNLIEGMAMAKEMVYTGDKFMYCPWCGSYLGNDSDQYIGNII